jgi:hypothetical protein
VVGTNNAYPYLAAHFMIRIFSMTNDNIDVYAQFLAQCREVMGPFDLEKLAYDQQYKADFFKRINISADDQLFQLAALVDYQLTEEMAAH